MPRIRFGIIADALIVMAGGQNFNTKREGQVTVCVWFVEATSKCEIF